MKTKIEKIGHEHSFMRSKPDATVETCACGRFRFTENAGPAVVEQRPIDYARMKREHPKQKAALTRAVKTGDVEKIKSACKSAVAAWNEIGAWPDDWNRWQMALTDALPWNQKHIDIANL